MGDTTDSSPLDAALTAGIEGDVGALARAIGVQGGHLAWLIGAGASAMSGIPTAGQLIVRFKHQLYCDAHGLDVQDIDPRDRRTRGLIEQYFDGANGLPDRGDIDEYAVAFGKVYPSADVRADLIAELCRGTAPNYGHYVLAALMATNRLSVVFTTNFDDLIETAALSVFDGMTPRPSAVVADLGDPSKAVRAFQKNSWPLVAKIHGDFRSDRLKNTTEELRTQDDEMRQVLQTACGQYGLVVVGYSGRDDSVMTVLREALAQPASFPSGIFWCYRPTDPPAPAVVSFLRDAQDAGRTVAAVAVDNFVELAGAIERAIQLPASMRTLLESKRPSRVVTSVPLPTGPTQKYPVVRFNALPITLLPAEVRRLDERGATDLRDLQTALRTARARGLIARRSGGQLVAAGHDGQLTAALAATGVTVTDDVVALDWDAPVVDPADLGFALDAFTLGLGRTTGLRHVLSRRAHQVRVSDGSVESLARLRSACHSLSGTVPKTTLPWAEAVTLNLDRRNGRWWLLLVPEVWVPHGGQPTANGFSPQTADERLAIADFIRERRATRYNRDVNAILDAWVRVLCSGLGSREIRTWNLGPGEGIDPAFEITGRTAYSRPLLTVGATGGEIPS
jgi:NAD-dependent SIR2 family protein deacetylase